MSKYREAEPWMNFKEIVSIPMPEYTLTYTVDGEEYKKLIVEEADDIPLEAEPTKEGYSFSGWSEIPEEMPANDLTISGTFTINKYMLHYYLDGILYKTYEIEYGATITPEENPSKNGYSFLGWSEIPEKMPSHDVYIYGSYEQNILGKCETPVINYQDGKLLFSCGTQDAEFVANITDADVGIHFTTELQLSATYYISVYAKKEGYNDSDPATAILSWIDSEPKTEGITNSVAEIRATPILIQSNDGMLTIFGAEEGTPISVYDTAGRLVGSAKASANATIIKSTLNRGEVGIVKIGSKSVKMLVK